MTCQLLLGKLPQRKLSLYETYRCCCWAWCTTRKKTKAASGERATAAVLIKVTIGVKCRRSLLSQLRGFTRGRKRVTGGYRRRGREAFFTLGEMWAVWKQIPSSPSFINLVLNTAEQLFFFSLIPLLFSNTSHAGAPSPSSSASRGTDAETSGQSACRPNVRVCVYYRKGRHHHISHFRTSVSRRLSTKRVWWGKKSESVIERTRGRIGGTRGEKGNERKKDRKDSGGAWERWRKMTAAAWNIPLLNAKHCREQQKHMFLSRVQRGQRVNK